MKIFSNVSFSLMGFLYIIITGGLCHILQIPEIVKGFLAVPGFLIIPYLVGNVFIPINFFKNNEWDSKVSREVISWMIGLIVLVLGAIIFVKVFGIFYYILIIFGMVGVKIFIFNKNQHLKSELLQHIKRNYIEISILCLIISLPLILMKGVSPFPLAYIVDPFHFSLAAHQIINNSSITQGMAYFPFLEIIVAIISIIYNINPFTLFWTGPFFSYSAFAIGIYLLMYQLSKNKVFSLIATFFAIFPAFYKATWAMVLNMFIPQLWIYFTFPFAIFIIHKILQQNINQISTKSLMRLGFVLFVVFILTYIFTMDFLPSADCPFKKSLYLTVFCFFFILISRLFFNTKTSIMLCIVFAILIMLHFPMANIAITLLLIYIFLHFLSKCSINYYYAVVYVLIFCITVSIFLQIPGHIQPPGRFFVRDNVFTYDFSQKKDLIVDSFSYFTFILFIIGAAYIILTRCSYNYNNYNIPLSFLTLSLIAMFIFFVNVPELIRAGGFFAIFGIYVVASGFLCISKQFNVVFFKNKKRLIIAALLLIIAVPLIFDPMLNFVMFRKVYASAEMTGVSTFTYADYNASLWIKNNVPNALIISDHWTGFVASGISGAQNIGVGLNVNIRKSIEKIITTYKPDEAHNIVTLILSQNISLDYSKIKKDDLFQAGDITEMRKYNFETNLTKKTPIIVITPLTIECKKGNVRCDWYSVGYVANKYLDESDPAIKKFFDSKYFELIYKNDKIYIFKVKL